MTGVYVVIGASVLGALSCVLIVWSLWTRSQARKRARQRQLATGFPTGQHAAIPPAGYPPAAGYPVAAPAGHTVVAGPPMTHGDEPRTEFMSSADLFGHVAPVEEPTQFLSDAELFAMAEPEDEHEASTAFMTDEELFAEEQAEQDEHEAATAFMTDEELFAEQQQEEDDEHEVPTAFMTTEQLFGGKRQRVDATTVIAEEQVVPAPRPADRPPVQRVPQAPTPARRPAPQRPVPTPARSELKPTLPGPKPNPTGSYTAFVGDRSHDDDDDDDDDDDRDLETELVHQADLLRLINPTKRSD